MVARLAARNLRILGRSNLPRIKRLLLQKFRFSGGCFKNFTAHGLLPDAVPVPSVVRFFLFFLAVITITGA